MNGMSNFGPIAVIPNTRLSAASRGFLALQGTGPSCTDDFGTQPRIRSSHEPKFVELQDQSVAAWQPAAAFAAVGTPAIDPGAALAPADKRAESLRKGHHATVNRRPHRRPG